MNTYLLGVGTEKYFNRKHVAAPKEQDISHQTTLVVPKHIDFTQPYSQRTEYVAKALWDSNRQDGCIYSTEGN